MKECKVEGCDSTELAKRSAMCREHHREYMRKHYKANKQYYVDKAGVYNKASREWVREKKSVPCMDCEESHPYYVMDFDHTEDKEFNISSCAATYGRAKLEAEIAKCDVVCSNCHRKRTWKRAQDALHV